MFEQLNYSLSICMPDSRLGIEIFHVERRLLSLIRRPNQLRCLHGSRLIRHQRYQKTLRKLKCKRFFQTLTGCKIERYLKSLAYRCYN